MPNGGSEGRHVSVATRRRPFLVSAVFIALVATVAVWFGVGYAVIADPKQNALRPADAIFVLGGPDVDGRANYGLSLASRGYAPVVAISVASEQQYERKHACANGTYDNAKVLCFQPDPRTTQGEARQLRAYAKEYGWKTVIVVTSSYHVSRARWILGRCYAQTLLMTSPRVRHSIWTMAHQYLYQSFSYVKNAVVTRGC